MKRTIDLRFENQFSLVLIRPLTVRGTEWVKEKLIVEPWQWLAGAVACDPKLAADIFLGAKSEGLGLGVSDYNGEVEQA